MFAALVLVGVLCLFLLILFLLHRMEINHITKQLEQIRLEETNRLVHSMGSRKIYGDMINEINILLGEVKAQEVFYSKKSRKIEQMMINMSHDLRTPLTSAMGYIDLIRNAEMTVQEKEHGFDIIEKRLVRLEELINSFFELEMIISRNKQPEMGNVNLIAVLEQSIIHYYDDYNAKGRTIHLNTNGKRKINLQSNKNMLMRIFDNLIGNALKHGIDDLKISLEYDNKITIVFENNISEDIIGIEHIFDEFYTTDISRTKGNAGLGLAIAKEFTEMLGGSIRATQENKNFRIVAQFFDCS